MRSRYAPAALRGRRPGDTRALLVRGACFRLVRQSEAASARLAAASGQELSGSRSSGWYATVRRAQLPDGGGVDDATLIRLADRTAAAIDAAWEFT